MLFLGVSFFFLTLIFIRTYYKNRQRQNKKNPQIKVFLTGYLFFLFLSFGPYLHVFGIETNIPLLYWILAQIDHVFLQIRVPARWLLVAQLFLAGIFGYMLIYVKQYYSKKTFSFIALVISLLIIIDISYLPRPIYPIQSSDYQILNTLQSDQPDTHVLHIPFNISSGFESFGDYQHAAQAKQILHQHPIIGGHISRLPKSYFDNVKEDKDLRSLIQLDITSLTPRFFSSKNIGFIIIDKHLLPEEAEQVSQSLQKAFTFELIEENDSIILLKNRQL